MKKKTILIVSHAHPRFSKGGGEIAAYTMYREMLRQGYDAYFLAAHFNEKARHGAMPFSILNRREILFFAPPQDYFFNVAYDKSTAWKDFRSVLDRIRPDIIHFHHYMHLGLDKIRETHNYRLDHPEKKVRIFMTLHEYIAICAHNGQMIRRDNGALCEASDYVECARCFPERNTMDFFFREKMFHTYFELIDHFISPSRFLKERYVAWGLAPERITAIENGQPPAGNRSRKRRPLQKGERRSRFGYFGQINPYKGLDTLLESIGHLSEKTRREFRLYLHGSGMENWSQEFQDKINTLLKRYEQNVIFYGAYEPEELPDLMSEIDWVIIPSNWWENSPLVIQEAFSFGKPVIAADIGGMAEKVTDGKDGLHFRARHPESLAETIERAMSEKGLYKKLHHGIRLPLTIEEAVKEHLKVYEK